MWVSEIQTLLPVCPQFVLSGNVHDQYFGPDEEDSDGPLASRLLMYLPEIVSSALTTRGVQDVIHYDIVQGNAKVTSPKNPQPSLEEVLGLSAEVNGAQPADMLLTLIQRVLESAEPIGLIITSASRLVRRPSALSEEEFRFFRTIEGHARAAQAKDGPEGTRIQSPIVWVVDNERDLPDWFTVRNDTLRAISVPLPHFGERLEMASRLVNHLLAEPSSPLPAAVNRRRANILAQQTAGMGIVSIQNIVRVGQDQGFGPDRIEDAARSYRLGLVENPWRAEHIVSRLRTELDASSDPPDDSGRLRDRVLGQDRATEKACDILLRSAAGLTAAQASPSATRPRGVLFFAGPTGVGKTELAKAITKLLFDDERFYIRFDMSEFSSEHSADRLIGAPPGYVGHDAGGELTNAIRERPFSVVLLDEIEKAHERILDKFLQVLDDGRLTDGRGETVYFTEAVVIFTSNLGIYREVEEVLAGGVHRRRELAITPESHTSYEERAAAIRLAIRDYFNLRLGRPELLNRIGEDNIVVFDFIDANTAQQIVTGMIENISRRVMHEHGFELRLTPASLERLLTTCRSPEVLSMGGRGIGARLETALINPLSRALALARPEAGQTLSVLNENGRWTASWT